MVSEQFIETDKPLRIRWSGFYFYSRFLNGPITVVRLGALTMGNERWSGR
ncbi:hypothetical protein CLV24_1098 [Pontibacter ummariensis]|uniref:Uncharacterized protein n=1 Tax=Pontibacter ummariensis TaxID=1610492 RepID=A0A239FX37_9BACT|nr:hypothetical protein CLV24_1098 [Pontibacter ummariensis]SNS61449.1 hypothetical protein SAMN06296052_109162 [Pontibacter ummariensis]